MATRTGTVKLVTYRGAPHIKVYLKNHSDAVPEFEVLFGNNFITKPVFTLDLEIGTEYSIRWDYYFLDGTTIVPIDPPDIGNNLLNFVVPA